MAISAPRAYSRPVAFRDNCDRVTDDVLKIWKGTVSLAIHAVAISILQRAFPIATPNVLYGTLVICAVLAGVDIVTRLSSCSLNGWDLTHRILVIALVSSDVARRAFF